MGGSATGNVQKKGGDRRPVGGERAPSKRPRARIDGSTQPPIPREDDMMGVLETGAEAGSGTVSPEDRQQQVQHLLQGLSSLMNIKPKELRDWIEQGRASHQS